MTIDDALANLKEPQKQEEKESDAGIFKVLRNYTVALNLLIRKATNAATNLINADLFALSSEYVRFTPTLSITYAPIPQEKVVQMILTKNPALASFFQNTDIVGHLPLMLDISKQGDSAKNMITNSVEFESYIPVSGLTNLQMHSQKAFAIYDLSVLSLFIPEGHTLRKYVEIVSNQPSDIFGIYQTRVFYGSINLNLSVEGLAKLYYATGIKKIKTVLDELTEIKQLMSGWVSSQNATEAREALYARLKKYTPALAAE